tara:strand:+ start:316 stop:714 length:399 start_codon:yes stop_codon:yes gene_type:complete
MMKGEVKKDDLLYPEESYEICGALFDVFKELGAGYREKNYQRAAQIEFEKKGFKVQKEVKVPMSYQGHDIGFYRLDFLINDKIIVELKCTDTTSRSYIDQTVAYLKSLNLQLCILAQFTSKGVKTRRILNIN